MIVQRAPHVRLVSASEQVSPPATLEQAFRMHVRYVGKIAFRILGRDEEVDDVVQDVFLAAFKGLRALREPDAIKGWLATVTVRVATRRLRRRKLRDFFGFDQHPYDDVAAEGASPEQRAVLASIYAMIDKLPISERVAWTLRHVEGMALEEVASACACSLATAKRRIAAARQKIDQAVSDD
jgi:RNA polymerase sigma-70 factor (ECF subfamily)